MLRRIFYSGLFLLCVFTNHSHAQSVFRFDPNVSAEMKNLFLGDLQAFSSIAAADQSPLNREVFGQASGEAYRIWFSGRIYSVGFLENSWANETARVDPDSENHKIVLASLYASVPQLYRLGIVLHEARHTEDERGFWPHAICKAGVRGLFTGASLESKASCDEVKLGSYGIQAIFYGNIWHHCSSCSTKTKADAELYARDTVNRIMNADAKVALEHDLEMGSTP